ncbi:TIR domain-containing adapter molecule 1 [Pungitius pungitius]|uniref:TIR domain-containing adapter molecule 1 n=1 Tax=Pungitius pungitius TaxID=134920 RepID=UPI002E0F602F
MSHEGQEHPETGLKDVLDILVKAPPQRLLSLTFQLGDSPEDNIVHALCLIILQQEVRALDKLQTLKDNYFATQLAVKLQISKGKLEDFAEHCGSFRELAVGSLAALARIFKVLSEQRMCDPYLRDLAYKRALLGDNQATGGCEKLDYDLLAEEAKVVCGPQCAEWACSPKDLRSGPCHDLVGSLDAGNTTLKVTLSQDQSERAYSLPSPLQETSSMPSYPTHLEISIPPTATFLDDKENPDESKLKTKPALTDNEWEANNTLGSSLTSQPESTQPPLSGANQHSQVDELAAAEGSKSLNQPTKPTVAPPTSTNIVLPKNPVPHEVEESNDAEEDEKADFYDFVILHAEEDEVEAERIREKMEEVIGSEGATYSGDFAIPGKSSLRCVEDAIYNSAFTFLLLTRNFHTRMLDTQTDCALINAINNRHKYNTVIPLLPKENAMPKVSLPLVLQTINPLEENRTFDRKIKKIFTPAKIRDQRKIWNAEQTAKREIERQERRKKLHRSQQKLIRERSAAQLPDEENMRLLLARKCLLGPGVPPEQGDAMGPWQHHPHSIHIEHAKYIMIGNDSTMTVSGAADKDDSGEDQ